MKKWFFTLLILSLLITACDSTLQKTTSVKNPPTPAPGLGAVTGKIRMDNPTDRIGLLVYLGDIVKLGDEFSGGFLDTSIAPHALVNAEDGYFFITDVKPGLYSFVIYEVVSGGRVYQDENGNVLPIEVTENKITDLGDIFFTFE